MHYFFWGCLRESRFRELLLSSISCTLSSRGCLVGRASFARCFLPLLSALASERASFSPLVSCSLLVEQIRESKRPELVLQNSLGTPQEWQGSLFICPSPHPEGAGIVKEVIFSSLICTTNWTQISFFFMKSASNSVLHYLSPFQLLNYCKNLECFIVLLRCILKTSILYFYHFES